MRYGRPAPNYSRSDPENVRVSLRGGDQSLEFATLIYEHEKDGKLFSLDELLVLNELFFGHQIRTDEAKQLMQKDDAEAFRVLERLVERGLVEARGDKRTRRYLLAAAIYRKLRMKSEYVRAKGFEPLQQEQMVLEYVRSHGSIKRGEAAELCQLSGDQASRLLRRLTTKYPQFIKTGEKRWAIYRWEE